MTDADEDVGAPILYLAVAELLAWLYRLEHGETPANSGVAAEKRW